MAVFCPKIQNLKTDQKNFMSADFCSPCRDDSNAARIVEIGGPESPNGPFEVSRAEVPSLTELTGELTMSVQVQKVQVFRDQKAQGSV